VRHVRGRQIGEHLRRWRQRRRLSQLDLATDADISARHLSFVETGRSQPSRDMVLHLAEQLRIPTRERNVLLVAAGYAPVYVERSLSDPGLAPARSAIDAVLERQKPYPAFALDRHWNVVASNGALPILYEDCAAELLQPLVNSARLTLHPNGVAKRVENLAEWRAHVLHRLSQQVDLTADPTLLELLQEVQSYPAPRQQITPNNEVFLPFKLRTSAGLLSFFTTSMFFGTPIDITLTELTLECFFPADAETEQIVRRLSGPN
jgi:transcriptional regulator with XRE-family HTH domain